MYWQAVDQKQIGIGIVNAYWGMLCGIAHHHPSPIITTTTKRKYIYKYEYILHTVAQMTMMTIDLGRGRTRMKSAYCCVSCGPINVYNMFIIHYDFHHNP